MKALWRSAATLAILAAVSLPPTTAQELRTSGCGPGRFRDLPIDPEAAKSAPHYEWQYHYAGRHAHWEGHWVLVEPSTAPACPEGASGSS